MILLSCYVEKNKLFKSVEEANKFVEETANFETIRNIVYRPVGDVWQKHTVKKEIVQERSLNDSIIRKHNIQVF